MCPHLTSSLPPPFVLPTVLGNGRMVTIWRNVPQIGSSYSPTYAFNREETSISGYPRTRFWAGPCAGGMPLSFHFIFFYFLLFAFFVSFHSNNKWFQKVYFKKKSEFGKIIREIIKCSWIQKMFMIRKNVRQIVKYLWFKKW